MTLRFPGILFVAAALAAAASTVSAATCLVDPGGALMIAGAHASTNAALAVCNAPGSVIEVRCPVGGCSDPNVVINGLVNITIRSSELDGLGGPVSFESINNLPALQIRNSAAINVSGISGFAGQQVAVWIVDSEASFKTPDAIALGRYTTFSAANMALLVEGSSSVTLVHAGFNDSTTGIWMTGSPAGAPHVTVIGAAFLHNRMAARLVGPLTGCNGPKEALLDIRGDTTTAWLNYVMENHEGFWLMGRSRVRLDHTVIANNLGTPGVLPNAYLFRIQHASGVEVRNALIYDNDASAALTPPYPGGMASGGASIIYSSESCAPSQFVATTIVNNAADVMFGFGRNDAGLLTLDHVAITGNWGKVFSDSAFWVKQGICPPVTLLGATVWNNRVLADPIGCEPPQIIGWSPNAVPNNPPRTLVNYPLIDLPPTSIFLINSFEPLAAAPLPPGLFVGRPWSVNGIKDESDNVLDVGYHNPR
jgi:hypothetical protein